MTHTPDNIESLPRNSVFVFGANLAGPDGDMTLYNRLVQEKKATTMSHSLIIRLALSEYFRVRDL